MEELNKDEVAVLEFLAKEHRFEEEEKNLQLFFNPYKFIAKRIGMNEEIVQEIIELFVDKGYIINIVKTKLWGTTSEVFPKGITTLGEEVLKNSRHGSNITRPYDD